MKECPRCKEKYPDGADTCPACYVDLDTGEVIGIDKDIDLEELKEAYGKLVFSFKVNLWSIAILLVSLIIMEVFPHAHIVYFLLEKVVIASLVAWLVMCFKLSSSINKVCEIIGEKSLVEKCFVWISPFLIGYGVYHRAKEILKKASGVT